MAGFPESYPHGSSICCFSLSLSSETLFDFSVIDAEELVRTGRHVDVIRFAFGTFLVQEAIDRIVDRFRLEKR